MLHRCNLCHPLNEGRSAMSHLSERVLSFRSLVYLAEDFAVTTRFEIANTSVGSVVVSLDHPLKTRRSPVRLGYIQVDVGTFEKKTVPCK